MAWSDGRSSRTHPPRRIKTARSKPSRCQRCRERLKNDRFEAALRDPAKRFVYRCDLCSRQFVLTMQIRSARYVCPACAPGVLPKTEEDLNRYLGYPR